jgi:hypothetical protein
MRRLGYLAAVILGVFATAPKAVTVSANSDDGLPPLYKIQSATLSPSYSCRSKEDFGKGYANTVLFLSHYSKDRNAPDLLFNGACKTADYFEGSTAGDDMSLIADLGEIRLEDVSAHLAFNPTNISGRHANFAMSVLVLSGHTYALVINKRDFRGLAVFHVEEYIPNKSVKLRYAVKEYQLIAKRTESEGFNWEGKNSE